MSLQVWLPFLGNLDNKGLYPNLEFSGTPNYDENGKLGKCLKGGTNIFSDKSLMEYEGTLAFWIYVDENTTTSQIYGNSQTGSTVNNRKWSLFCFPDRNSLHSWGCQGDSESYADSPFTLSGVLEDGKWTHVAYAHDRNNQYVYINGELKLTQAWNSNKVITFDVRTQILWANSTRKINDLRIYDECLSQKQIHKLAQGLVAHYKLSRPMPNIVKGTYDMSGIGGKGVIISEKYNGYNIKYLSHIDPDITYEDNCAVSSFLTPKANTYYTCSFWAKGSGAIYSYFYPDCCANVINSVGFGSTARDGNNTIQLTSEWKKYWIIYRTLPDVTGVKNFIVGRLQGTQNLGKDCYIAGIKFEEGYNKCPTWSPHPDDPEYYSLGYSNRKEIDVSGNGYDLEYSSIEPEIHKDTPLHSSSFGFSQGLVSASSGTQYLHRSPFTFLNHALTFSCWIYQDRETSYSSGSESSNQVFLSQGRNYNYYGVNLQTYKHTNNVRYIRLYFGSNPTRVALDHPNVNLSTWYHVAVTWDGNIVKLYVNGTLSTSANIDTVDYSDATTFVIGKMAYASTYADRFFPFVGNISDVRIYSTALSATDIKELYENRARIDNKGNYHTYELMEE